VLSCYPSVCDSWCQKWDWFLPDIDRYTTATEQSLQQMTQLFLSKIAVINVQASARQEELNADLNAQAAVRQAKADAKTGIWRERKPQSAP
jgi:PIN domain nuclease of toxin-antitoxin system